MTTKHVVADDLLGQVERKQWEITRRVLEGTLDPERLLQSLQQLIEGRSTRLPIEEIGFTVGERTYSVQVQRQGEYEDAFRACGNLALYFPIYHEPPRSWVTVPNGNGPKKVKLGLAYFERSNTFGAAITKLELEGYGMADAWDLLAFAKTAPMFQTIPADDQTIYAFGTRARNHYTDPNSKGEDQVVYLSSHQRRGGYRPGWSVFNTSWRDSVGSGTVQKGCYVLVRRK